MLVRPQVAIRHPSSATFLRIDGKGNSLLSIRIDRTLVNLGICRWFITTFESGGFLIVVLFAHYLPLALEFRIATVNDQPSEFQPDQVGDTVVF